MADNLKKMKRCPECGTLNDDDSLFCMNCRCDLSSVEPEDIDEEPTDSFFAEEINHKPQLERPNTELYEGIIPPIHESESVTESMSQTTSTIPVIPPENNPEPKRTGINKYYIIGAVAAVLLAAGIGIVLFMNKGESQVSAYDSHIAQGQKYVSEKKYDAAIDEFEQAKKIDPKKEEAYENLYYTYEKQGDLKQQQFVYNEYKNETGKTQKDMQEAQKEIYIIIVQQPEPQPTNSEDPPEQPKEPATYDEEAPTLEEWENVTDWSNFDTSKEYTYEIKWSAVNEAEGYELNYILEKDTVTEYTDDIKDTKFQIKFKECAGLIGKVRAYKTVDGVKVYTPWSGIESKTQKAIEKECEDLNPAIELAPLPQEEPEVPIPDNETSQPDEDTGQKEETTQKEETANTDGNKKEEEPTTPVENEPEKEEEKQEEPEVVVEQYPKDVTPLELLEEVYEKYVFSNGLGWKTEVQIDADGTIHGHYHYETFDSGEGYDVTRTESYFTAKLKNIKKMKDGVFTAEFTEYKSENPGSGEQIIEEGPTKIKVVYMDKTYGFDNCKTLTFYGPDTPITEFNDQQRSYLPDQNMSGEYGWLLNNEDDYLMWGTIE